MTHSQQSGLDEEPTVGIFNYYFRKLLRKNHALQNILSKKYCHLDKISISTKEVDWFRREFFWHLTMMKKQELIKIIKIAERMHSFFFCPLSLSVSLSPPSLYAPFSLSLCAFLLT